MKTISHLCAVCLLAFTTVFAVTGCEQKSGIEKAGEEIKDGVEDATGN